MTNEEAKKMLKAKLECFKNETSGINYDCNMRLCDGCSLNYEQGNMGEQKEALQMAIKALEQQPNEDCISREVVMRILKTLYNFDDLKDLKVKQQEVMNLPSVTPKARWIPVSERLPEGEGWYLTSLGDKTYGGADVDMYCKGWVKYGNHVLAWMPLPQPYKAESVESE